MNPGMPELPDRLPIPEQIPETHLVPRRPTLLGNFARIRFLGRSSHKIGGEPDWIQGDETPACCGRPMMFYGQLGSLHGKYDLIDNGIIYIFICRKCLKTQSVFQFS
jgi:hypothetical protein